MRHRTDSLQGAVVNRLRAAGWAVQSLSQVGHGVPDLLVATPHGETFLVEVKAAGRSLSPAQMDWHRRWPGRIEVVRSLAEVEALIWACTNS